MDTILCNWIRCFWFLLATQNAHTSELMPDSFISINVVQGIRSEGMMRHLSQIWSDLNRITTNILFSPVKTFT